MNKARDRMVSTEIELFSDIEWQLTACLRIITYEKASCSKIEKLSACENQTPYKEK